ncbi:MAG TPA: biopolymer transporter ExbD [Oculatellaceae cyanobacterium]
MSMGAVGDEFAEINVTPLTDVFLVLLVIMILIAPLIDKSDLKIKPPESKNAKKADESKGITIDIDKEGQMAINNQFVDAKDPAAIKARISELVKKLGNTDVPCTVNADGDSKERIVVEVMTAAAEAGLKRMRVATVQASNY